MTQTLGQLLKQCRESKGWTLRHVEETSKNEITNGYLSQLENGEVKNPSPHKLHLLAGIYNASYSRFLELAGYTVPDQKKRTSGIAFSLSDDLTPEEDAELAAYLKFMREKNKK